MFCANCGAKMKDDDLFCNTCGAKRKEPENAMAYTYQSGNANSINQVPENVRPGTYPNGSAVAVNHMPIKPKSGGKSKLVVVIGAAVLVVIIAVLAVLLITKPANTSSSLMIKEGNFSKPEDAVEHFVTAIADNDIESALSACAVNEAAQNFDAAAYIERMKMVPIQMAAPSEYEFYEKLNQASFLGQITNQMKFFAYSLVDSEAANELSQAGQVIAADDAESFAADFVKDTDPAVLKGIKIERVDLPVPDLYNSEENQRNMKKTAALYGADEATDRIMLFELDGTTYFVCFTLLRYDGNWKIFNMSSPIAGTTAFGSATEITKNDYLALVGE